MFCFAIACSSNTNACDACGCSVNGFGIGLMTDYRSNFIRLGYFDTQFSSNPEHGHHNSSDVFTRMNVSFRYSFKKLSKLRFMGDLSYGRNTRSDSGSETSIGGFSDTRLIVNYALLNTMAKNMKTAFYLEAGGGLSLPTGRFNADIVSDEDLPENFNIGNGSLGYIFQMNAVLSHNKYGFLINNNYQLNSRTAQGYHFGNQFSSQLTAFREFPTEKFSIIPNAGLLYERISSDEYSNKNQVPEKGGEGLFFSSAINFKTEKWLAGVSYSLPIDQHYSGGVIDAGNRLAVHFSYLF